MELLDILKIINIAVTLVLLAFAYSKLKDKQSRVLFIAMYVFLTLSTILFGEEGRVFEWLKHLPFYVGQLILFFFLKRIIELHLKGGNNNLSDTASASKEANLYIHLGFFAWLLFVTDQGLQHILVLPFHSLIISYLRVQSAFIKDEYLKKTLNIFMLGAFALAMVHVGEFVVESQKLLPMFYGDPIEYIEIGWFYVAAAIFYIGLKRIKQ